MDDGKQKRGRAGIFVALTFLAASVALAIYLFASARWGLGAAMVALIGAQLAAEGVRRSRTDSATVWLGIARQLLLAGALLWVAALGIASRTSWDWVVILPIGLLEVCLAVVLYVVYRRVRRAQTLDP